MPPGLPTTQQPGRTGRTTLLCLLSAQDSFQLIDFKFFLKKLQTFQNLCLENLKENIFNKTEFTLHRFYEMLA